MDDSFRKDEPGVVQALKTPSQYGEHKDAIEISNLISNEGIGELETLKKLAPIVLGGAAHLGEETSFCPYGPSHTMDHLGRFALDGVSEPKSSAPGDIASCIAN